MSMNPLKTLEDYKKAYHKYYERAELFEGMLNDLDTSLRMLENADDEYMMFAAMLRMNIQTTFELAYGES